MGRELPFWKSLSSFSVCLWEEALGHDGQPPEGPRAPGGMPRPVKSGLGHGLRSELGGERAWPGEEGAHPWDGFPERLESMDRGVQVDVGTRVRRDLVCARACLWEGVRVCVRERGRVGARARAGLRDRGAAGHGSGVEGGGRVSPVSLRSEPRPQKGPCLPAGPQAP